MPCNNHDTLRAYPAFKASVPRAPEGGWTNEALHTRNGTALVRAISSARATAVASEMRGAIAVLRAYFTGEFSLILQLAEQYHEEEAKAFGLDTKAGTTPSKLSAWHRAIRDGSKKSLPKLLQGMTPRLERSGRKVLWDTARLLGMKPKDIDPRLFHAQSKEIAGRLSGLAKTTRQRLAGAVSQAIKDKLTVKQTIAKLRKRFPQLTLYRINTIARTELGRAADNGQLAAYRLYGKVTHVSVVGCMHVEVNSPRFRNVPTCNIKNVPEKYSDELEFHPNHTGSIVPSGFRRADGSVPKLRLQRGVGRYD